MIKITNTNQYRINTFIHKLWVFYYVLIFALRILWRGVVHDLSKFSKFEAEGYGEYLPRFKQSAYGDKNYQELMVQLRPILEHHYRHNRHHPEHFENAYSDMNLLDVVEMLCDWQASVRRQKDGNIFKSIEHCKARFNLSDDLAGIMKNTITDIKE